MSGINKDDPRLEDFNLDLTETTPKFKPDIDVLVVQKDEKYLILDLNVPGHTYETILEIRKNLPTSCTPEELDKLLPTLCDKFGKQSAIVHLKTGKDRDGILVDPNPIATFDRLNKINNIIPNTSPEKAKLN
jgi:hypothetical protein